MSTRDEMVALLKQEVKGLTSYLEDPTDYENACADAVRDTGWSFPVSGETKEKWQKQRAKRHLFFYLWSESAHKFKYKQVNLQYRFAHYEKLISKLDADWEKAQDELLSEMSGVSAYNLFGTKVDAGFAYEHQTGRDITYDEDQTVIHNPNENS